MVGHAGTSFHMSHIGSPAAPCYRQNLLLFMVTACHHWRIIHCHAITSYSLPYHTRPWIATSATSSPAIAAHRDRSRQRAAAGATPPSCLYVLYLKIAWKKERARERYIWEKRYIYVIYIYYIYVFYIFVDRVYERKVVFIYIYIFLLIFSLFSSVASNAERLHYLRYTQIHVPWEYHIYIWVLWAYLYSDS